MQELEEMGIDALTIINNIMKEFPHVFKSPPEKKLKFKELIKITI